MPDHLLDRLRQNLAGFRGSLQPDQPLAPIVWFRAGGPAEILAMPADAEDLALLMRAVPEDVPVTVIGLGSNLLVRDGGIPGVVIRLSARGFGHVVGRRKSPAGRRGARRHAVSRRMALEAGLGGFAFYHGIPGGIGGALRMNAGANGVETRDRAGRDRRHRPARRAPRPLQCRDGLHLPPLGRRADDLIFVEAVYEGTPADPRDDPRADGRGAGAPRDAPSP